MKNEFKEYATDYFDVIKATPEISDQEWNEFANQLILNNVTTREEAQQVFSDFFDDRDIIYKAFESVDHTKVKILLQLAIKAANGK